MNNEIKFDVRKLKLFYFNFRYSAYYPISIPLGILVISFFIVWLFIIPQVQSWFSIQDEIRSLQDRIAVVKSNIAYMQTIDTNEIDARMVAVNRALPSDKNFAGILAAISGAATTSNVITQDYNFIVGTVMKKKTTSDVVLQQQIQSEISENGLIPLTINISIDGSMQNISLFIHEVETRLPLAKIKSLEFSDGKATIAISFYTKVLPDIKIKDEQSITVLTPKDSTLIKQVQDWGSK